MKTDTALPAGHYIVDVLVNNERTGRANIVITEEDEKITVFASHPNGWITPG